METTRSRLFVPRKCSITNCQTVEKDYQREIQNIEAKRTKMKQIEESRRQAIAGTREEQLQLQKQRKQDYDRHLELKGRKEHENVVKEKTFIKQIPNVVDTRPKTAPLSEIKPRETPRDRYIHANTSNEKRREYMKSLMVENMKLQQQREETRRREIQADKQPITVEHFHNRGRSFL
ncbi:hypothetical protein NAEGRDRAFT_79967 [Naegleria gruberi]|uniref:Uncharacterized protein n=1 Tax=Naegleria gruberi TaxID=5762 RepID=D2VH46_NAEGR|nr:uncharacterized protein NAEGRDRAFT_79967 [Naegleria gruberi]EFC43917.1 hypothetical protein NAEGRDRAFT_79967 [Naegleria gruberi]|eukprot:XP_002676661.1 hypothetical protein NAEGRDRAFT_79967 [Naegleria gruberi strain NEG-M]